MELNEDFLLDNLDKLDMDEYIPLVLINYINQLDYFNNINDDVKEEVLDKRLELQYCEDYDKYLEMDLNKWIKNHPSFKGIIK